MLERIVDFVFPPVCAGCGILLEGGSGRTICQRCTGSIAPIREPICDRCGIPLSGGRANRECQTCVDRPPAFRRARALAQYHARSEEEDVLGSILRRHKYGLNQALSRTLREVVGGRLPFDAAELDVVVPVPLHWRRLRWRGFNQAALLAIEIARIARLPIDFTNVVRTRATDPQTAADSATRHANVRDAFAIRRPEAIANKRVLLVDDILTTGATVGECARAILKAGARQVDVFTLARAL